MKNHGRPMGIMAMFSNVSFRKDGEELFTARVSSGGCFGPDKAVDVINRGYSELKRAIDEGRATTAALDFNTVAVGANEYAVGPHAAGRIKATDIKRLAP